MALGVTVRAPFHSLPGQVVMRRGEAAGPVSVAAFHPRLSVVQARIAVGAVSPLNVKTVQSKRFRRADDEKAAKITPEVSVRHPVLVGILFGVGLQT